MSQFLRHVGPSSGQTIDSASITASRSAKLVKAIIARFPAMRREMLDENGNLYSHVHIFVNGRCCYLENRMSTVIQAEDILNIFPPVGGG
jgi:molybdopterin synthase sulfur carrier subunit